MKKNQNKGTSWKRRGHAIAAGVALVALSAVGSSAIIGNASAKRAPASPVITQPVTEPVTEPIVSYAKAGWGG